MTLNIKKTSSGKKLRIVEYDTDYFEIQMCSDRDPTYWFCVAEHSSSASADAAFNQYFVNELTQG
jgi:hypothetical protein